MSSSPSKTKHSCGIKAPPGSGLSSFGNMTLQELIEMGKKMRPSVEKIKEITDGEFCELMQKNCKNWFPEPKFVPSVDIPEESLPKYFQNAQTVKLYKVVEAEAKSENEAGSGTGDSKVKEIDDAVIEGITRPRYVIGEAGSSQPFRCLDYAIPSIHDLQKGARFWVIIEESSNAKLEKFIAQKTGDDKSRKPGCLGGEFLIEMSELTKHQIKFIVAVQREGDTIVTLPGVYYYWVNLIDFTEVACIHFTDICWFRIRNKIEENRCSCRNKFILNWTKMEENYKSNSDADEEDISAFPSSPDEGISSAYRNAVKSKVKKRECKNKRSKIEETPKNGQEDETDDSDSEDNSDDESTTMPQAVETESDLTKPLENMTID